MDILVFTKKVTNFVTRIRRSLVQWRRLSEKGIWCKSKTIPVAVNSTSKEEFFTYFATGNKLGRRKKWNKSEDLPKYTMILTCRITGYNHK